jgi:ABC-type uncharacterized transport system permease subunit
VPDIVIHVVASACYAALAAHLWHTRWRTPATASGRGGPAAGLAAWERAALLLPLALHGWLLYDGIFAAEALRFGFAQALSVMLWLAVAILWLEGLVYRIEMLLPLALAAAALCAPLPAFFPGRLAPEAYPVEFRLHLVAGMLAYSLFTVATLHAVLISVIERRLHAHPTVADSGMPLLSLEALVFRLTAAAFVVLTLTFAMGVAYSEHMVGRALRFDHKTVFVMLSWATFGLLLAGRWLYGWRGRTAFRWTLAGFVMLMLAYPGSRFVLEVVLGRG